METPRTQFLQVPLKASGLIPLKHLVLICSLALATTVWAWILIEDRQGYALESFLIVLGVYGAASAVFIGSRLRSTRFEFFDIPTFVTILAFVEFGVAPLGCFLTQGQFDPSFHGHSESFTRALIYLVLGMIAFWAGSHLAGRGSIAPRMAALKAERGAAASPPLDPAILRALALYGVAFLVKAYFLVNFGYDYGTSLDFYFDHLAAMQVANVIFQFGTFALIILAIERFLNPSSLERNVLFWIVLVSECVWGLLSGMKSNLLQNFVVVALVSSMAERRLKKGWLAAAVLGLVIVYPFSVQYRELVRGRTSEAMGFEGAEQMAGLALARATESDSTPFVWLESGAGAALSRLNLLQSVAAVLSLGPRADYLKGSERWWMLPFYPFVPRFLWPTKPILDKGRRFSMALGYGDQTSTAMTYPGDLYFEYGVPGLLAGMFLFGLVAQWLTNRLSLPGSKRRMFVYTGLFITVLFVIELDAFDFWSTLIRSLVILSAVAWAVYRHSSDPRRKTHGQHSES
ncbi:MAG TPA: hypothetical protein VI455_06985 [Terriglobia bacterium]